MNSVCQKINYICQGKGELSRSPFNIVVCLGQLLEPAKRDEGRRGGRASSSGGLTGRDRRHTRANTQTEHALTQDSGQWTESSKRCTVESEQLSMDKGQ